MSTVNNNLINLNYLIGYRISSVKEYLKFNGVKFNNDDIEVLLDFIYNIIPYLSKEHLKDFILGYRIDRIDKEFDILKVGTSVIINIELKKKNESLSQAKLNYDILKTFYSDRDIYVFDYCKELKRVLFYNDKNKIFEQSSISDIIKIIELVDIPQMIEINYDICSVYKNPCFFLDGKFFLSSSQKDVFEGIINNLNEKIIIVQGNAGTGKSLLSLHLHNYLNQIGTSQFLAPIMIYDIIDRKLISKYEILTVKKFVENPRGVEYIVVDESQNITDFQLKVLKEHCKCLILFGDNMQNYDGVNCFQYLCSQKEIKKFNLKGIVRTDNTFVCFANKVFNYDAKKKINVDPNKIDIKMYNDDYCLDDYTLLEPIKSLYYENCMKNEVCKEKKCLDFKRNFNDQNKEIDINVCGLEYDKVVIFLCDGFKIKENENNKTLTTIKPITYHNLRASLYLIMTRAISKLLIVTDDLEVYNYLMAKKMELK